MKIYITILLTTIFNSLTFGQNTEEVLFGFKLGQYYECLENNFGDTYKVIEDGELTYNVYLINNDINSYIIFGLFQEQIYSIQLFSLSAKVNPKFRLLKMGENRESVINALGIPHEIKKNELGGELFSYNNSNFTIEINKNKLSSIKIWNNQNLYEQPKLEELPTIEDIKNLLQTGDNKIISKILSPSIEFWGENGKVDFFNYPWVKEILYDYSGMYEELRNFYAEIKNKKYEQNIRLIENENPLIVYKFESNDKILELTFKNEFGKFLIWEIKSYHY